MAATAQSSTKSNSITLINPPSPPGITANREGAGGFGAWSDSADGFLYPPHSLAYAAAVLREGGWHVQLVDAAGLRLNTTAVLELARRETGLIAVQAAHISLDNDIAFINQLRTTMRQPIILVTGASTPLIELSVMERTDADHILAGEPEAMLLPLCEALASSPGQVKRSVTVADLVPPGANLEGRVIDLDSLPFPAWDLVDLQRYGFVTFLASRGCDDTCAFCPYAVGQGRHMRLRSAERVVEEMAWLAAAVHVRRVIVRDPVFAHDRRHVEDICRGMIKSKVSLSWECESRPEHFDVDLLRLMQRAGCTTIKLGFETSSGSALRLLRRIPPLGSPHTYMQQTASVVTACRNLGLACRIFLMTGLPRQTDADVADTIAFLHSVRPTAVHVKPFHRYPGLPMAASDSTEDAQRGRRQAQALQSAMSDMVAQPVVSPLRSARRWLAKRIGR
jgi:anaerobic magnesium-protoporphyrin IX monomethyl ester cyclase